MSTTRFEKDINSLFAAEIQFRLASAVRIAVGSDKQPTDLPLEWSHGEHRVRYHEIALRPEQADVAAAHLHRTATYMLAMAAKDAIRVAIPDPKNAPDPQVRNAYQIARLVRNAFAHSPFDPIWSIDSDCKDQVFELDGIASLDTSGLNGQPFDWRHYGGPLALLRLARFVRCRVLGDTLQERTELPLPGSRYYQQGNLVLERIDSGSPLPGHCGKPHKTRAAVFHPDD